jgi:hypothetical protein
MLEGKRTLGNDGEVREDITTILLTSSRVLTVAYVRMERTGIILYIYIYI